MSLLLSQPSKLCFRKPVFVRSSPLLSNGLSSSSLPEPPGFVLVCIDPCRPSIRTIVTSKPFGFNPPSIEEWPEKLKKRNRYLEDLRKEMGTIGSSNGWLPTVKDGVLCFRDIAPDLDADPKRISLPPLVTLPHCQTQFVTNVVMSSSSPEDEDCVVAVKFLGPQISFCRPAQSNPEWINIRIENPCFFSSPVMFSKKHDTFRVPGSGGHLVGSWDPCKDSDDNPKLQILRFQNLPKLTKAKRDILDSCYTSEYLVESRITGETFMVKHYRKTAEIIDSFGSMKTEALMVFKLDDEGNAVYTQDIGEQSIVLTKSEPFCVPSSSFICWRHRNYVRIRDVDERTVVKLAEQKWNCSRQARVRYYKTKWDRV